MAGTTQSHAFLRATLERRLDELPVLPTVVAQLMVLDRTAEDYFDRVLELVETEPNFAARILSSANSAASSPREPISSLQAAVARLGSTGAASLVVALSVTSVFTPRDDWEKSLWRHAIQVALAARSLVHASDNPALSPDEAYACGLLHDVGRFVMFLEAPDQLRLIDEGDWDTADQLVRQEEAICGLNHAELGALTCEKWGLPESISYVVRMHHSNADSILGTYTELAQIVRLADFVMFPSVMPGHPGLAQSDEATIEQVVMPKVPPSIMVSAGALLELIRSVTIEADELSVVLGVS